MYLLYLLLIVAHVAVGADLPLPSTPPQPINGMHYRYAAAQGLKKDSPLKVSQDDNDMLENVDNITPNNTDDDDLIFPMDKNGSKKRS